MAVAVWMLPLPMNSRARCAVPQIADMTTWVLGLQAQTESTRKRSSCRRTKETLASVTVAL